MDFDWDSFVCGLCVGFMVGGLLVNEVWYRICLYKVKKARQEHDSTPR